MSNCDKLKESFTAYLDGELAPAERKKFEEEIAKCPEAKQTLTRMQMVLDKMHQLTPIKTSADFENKLHRRIQATQPRRSERFPLLQLVHWKIPAIGFVLILLAVSAFSFFSTEKGNINIANPQGAGLNRGLTDQAKTPAQNATKESAVSESVKDTTKKNLPDEELKKKIKLVNEKVGGK